MIETFVDLVHVTFGSTDVEETESTDNSDKQANTGKLCRTLEPQRTVPALLEKKLEKELKESPKKFVKQNKVQAKKFDTNVFIEAMKKEIKNTLDRG